MHFKKHVSEFIIYVNFNIRVSKKIIQLITLFKFTINYLCAVKEHEYYYYKQCTYSDFMYEYVCKFLGWVRIHVQVGCKIKLNKCTAYLVFII